MPNVRLFTFIGRSAGYQSDGYCWDLPGSVHEVYGHMRRVYDSVGPGRYLPFTQRTVLPSAIRETVDTPLAQLFGAQYLAYPHPCQRLPPAVTHRQP